MKHFLLICLLFCGLINAQQKPALDYYLPQNTSYNKNIPTPKSIFHFELGEMHTDHSQVAQYMNVVAKASDRILDRNNRLYFMRTNHYSYLLF